MALTIESHRHQKQEMKNAYFEVENEASAIRMFETIDVLISIFITTHSFRKTIES